MNDSLKIKFGEEFINVYSIMSWVYNSIREPGTTTIKAAFILPKDIMNFAVGYRTLAKGEGATLN